MNDSILSSIKTLLGINASDTAFDGELIVFINAALHHAYQIGAIETPFKITGSTEKWSSVINETRFEELKSYVYYNVRLTFDPPTSSAVLEAFKQILKECEWRLLIEKEVYDGN